MKKCLYALLLSLFALPAFGQDDAKRTITVSGTGKVSATPDVAYIRLGVVTDDLKVSAALSANKKAMSNVFDALKKKNVADKDVCTTNFRVDPKFAYPQNAEPKLVGFTVSNEVTVTVRDLDKVSDLLDSLTGDGAANRVTGVSFDVLDKTALLDKAREDAVNDALRKANLLTKTAGASLGSVITITEQEYHNPRLEYAPAMRAADAGSTPVAKGERQFTVNVNLVIGLKDGKLGLGAGGPAPLTK